MQATVRTPLTEITATGEIPKRILNALRKEYGEQLILTDDESESIDARDLPWFHEESIKPNESIRILREARQWTQRELGEKLGGVSARNVSAMENNHRGISKEIAKKLARIFDSPVEWFL